MDGPYGGSYMTEESCEERLDLDFAGVRDRPDPVFVVPGPYGLRVASATIARGASFNTLRLELGF